jgi:predicted kinase
MTTNGKLIICRGLPASFKSTWAKEQVRLAPNAVTEVNRDDLRAMLHNSEWSKENEQVVVAARDAIIRKVLGQKRVVICSDTNGKTVQQLIKIAENCGASYEIRNFPCSVEEAIRRDALREGVARVGEGVIRRMAAECPDLVDGTPPPADAPKVVGSHTNRFADELPVGLPLAVVTDLDGTAALNKHGRSYYDVTDADVMQDEPNGPVIDYLKWQKERGRAVIAVSGREDSCRHGTWNWLVKHLGFAPDMLLMRKAGDQRKDAVVKDELYEGWINGRYAVETVLDDRSSVIEMWRSFGLNTWQVAWGDF